MEDLSRLRQAFYNSPEYSVKWESYFPVYSELFSKFVGKKITFLEVGVLHGGSLFMWREYLGPEARIIGIDLNPEAIKWQEYGFEIFIGDQADSNFWKHVIPNIGCLDVVLDDGGHTNLQQIQTIKNLVNSINDGGLIVIEDTQTSYQRDFGNPSPTSGVEFAKSLIDAIASRNPELNQIEPSFTRNIQSIRFFESIFAIYVNSESAQLNKVIANGREQSDASDFRYFRGGKLESSLRVVIKKFGYRFSASRKSKFRSASDLPLRLIQFVCYLLLKKIIRRQVIKAS